MYVHDLDLFVTVQQLEDTPAVLSSGKFCEEHGYTNEWASGQKPHLTKNGKRILRKTKRIVPVAAPGLSSRSSSSWSSTSFPQDSSGTSPSPARLRSDDETKNQNEDNIQATSNRLRDLPQTISKTQKCQHSQTLLMTQIRNVLRKWQAGTLYLYSLPKKPKLRAALDYPTCPVSP